MKLLLDTHTFIWMDSEPENLSSLGQTLCGNPTHVLLLSVASVWEIEIKLQIGKLTLRMPLPEIIEHQQRANNLQILPITLTHIFALPTLPLHHRDPFDRLLIAQANIENATLLSKDSVFGNYSVKVMW